MSSNPPPPSRDPKPHLEDIRDSIDHIREFLDGMSFETYQSDRKSRSAVERELLIISEAAVRLGDAAEDLCPGIPWNEIRGIGNTLRHAYHRVDDRIIWNTVHQELGPLRRSVEDALNP